MFVQHVSPQAAALGEVLVALLAHERPLTRMASLVPVEVARVGEGARAHVAAEGTLARVHACMDAHIAAAAAAIAALIALQRTPVADSVEGQLRRRIPGDHQGTCVSETR